MSDRHITDEEIHEASDTAPRDPPGIPKATCLACGVEHAAYYACMAHECRIVLSERRPYWEWLLLFQKWGYGVLKEPSSMKFPRFNYVCSGRAMLTQHLQADIVTDSRMVLRPSYYHDERFKEAGFPYAD